LYPPDMHAPSLYAHSHTPPALPPSFLFQRSAHPPDLHSFPTRRSSDLSATSPSGTRARRAPEAVLIETACGANTSPLSLPQAVSDRKSTRLNSSHLGISYAVFCLKKKNKTTSSTTPTSIRTAPFGSTPS